MQLPPNPLKLALARRKPCIGLWSSLCSNLSAEVIAGAGFDWLVLDGEHAPNDLAGILGQLQAVAPYPVEPVVRLPVADRTLIKQYLDIGARSLLLPFVQDEDQARDLVAATRYPPHGARGVSVAHRANRFGRVAGYHAQAHEDLCIIMQIETAEALARIDAIASVDGVDALFIGPSDLAAALGHLGNSDAAGVQSAISAAMDRCRALGKPLGILAPVEQDARRYLSQGFLLVAVGSDLGLLARGADALAGRFKDILSEPANLQAT